MLEPAAHTPVETIDLSVFVANPTEPDLVARRYELQKLARACRTAGVFHLVGHGMEPSTLERLRSAFDRFFELPEAERMEIAVAPGEAYGYEPLDPRIRDANDSFNCLVGLESLVGIPGLPPVGENRWPRRPEGLEETLRAGVREFHAVGARVLSAIAESLELPPSYFDPFLGPVDVASVRARRYPPRPAYERRLGAGAHVDGPPLTLIVQNEVVGLETEVRGHGWTSIEPIPGAIVCQLGSLFARWTNDRYVANHHRVRNLDPSRERRSIVYWFPIRPDAVIRCLPSCCSEAEPERYPPIGFMDYLMEWTQSLEHGDPDDDARSVRAPSRGSAGEAGGR